MNESVRMSCILITGASGLIGRALCRELHRREGSVLAVDLCASADSGTPIPVRACDVRDRSSLDALGEVTGVLHAAAVLPATFEQSAAAAEANRIIDANVIDFAAARDVPLVYFSGTSVYGFHHNAPDAGLDESTPLDPPGAYIEEKVWAEHYGAETFQNASAGFTALRVCAPYGPDMRARTVLTIFAQRAVEDRPLLYHGRGTREQDFTHVDDVAHAARLALKGPGGVFNIAAGEPVSMRQLAERIARLAGTSDVQPSGQDDPQEGVLARFDTRRAKDILGWEATIPLQQGLEAILAQIRRDGQP